jgi:YVTN family beta-propeller protein
MAAPSEFLGGPAGPTGGATREADNATPTVPGATPALPPEVELSFDFELPHAGEHYVYAANPDSDSVAVIDAKTLAIQSVEAGDQPRFLQTLGGTDAVVVLNVASNDASIIRTNSGASTTEAVPVQPGANAIAVAPDGKHAVVYFDALQRSAGTTGSYQDISVLFLDPGSEESVAMTVGFRPSSVSFAENGKRAFVITEDGVSILDFDEVKRKGAHIAETLPLGDDANTSLDVSVTPDGAYALARREGDSQLRLLDLSTGDVELLDLGAVLAPPPPEPQPEPVPVMLDAGADAAAPPMPPVVPEPAPVSAAITDVDLAPSGDYALAVVRDQSVVLRVPVPFGFTDPSQVEAIPVEGELIGSVSIAPNSQRALLFTTVVPENERVTVLDVDSGDFDVVRLPKSIERVTIAPDSSTALIVHQKLPGSPDEAGLDPDTVIDRSYGYSVLDLDTGFSKLQTVSAPVGPSTVVPDGSALFVLVDDEGHSLREVHRVGLQSFLVDRIVLGSPPTSVGAVPGSHRVFVGQDHPDGRISFIDWQTGDIESVTGFELNSRIRE